LTSEEASTFLLSLWEARRPSMNRLADVCGVANEISWEYQAQATRSNSARGFVK
jgi:hypothetical protein